MCFPKINKFVLVHHNITILIIVVKRCSPVINIFWIDFPIYLPFILEKNDK